jgi:cytochrome b561
MTTRYTGTAIVLHWLTALLILCTIPLGMIMSDLKLSPLKLQLYSYHKWIGVTVLLLVLVRLAWRISHKPPALQADLPLWQQRAAHAVHNLLYLLMLCLPVSGWLMSSAKGVPVVYLGLLQLPDLVSKDKALGKLLETMHELLSYILLLLLALHLAAVIQHHFIDRDDTLSRMLPQLKRTSL